MKGLTAVLTTLLVGALSAGAAPASAQGAPGVTAPTRIAFVNVGVALRAMPGWAQAESLFVKEREAAGQELQTMQAALDTAGTAFQQQSPMLSPTNRTARQRELQQQQEKLQARYDEIQQIMGRREQELLNPMQERLTAIIDGIRAEGTYAVIFDIGAQTSGMVISMDRSLDITARVLQRIAQSPEN
ncbi:MAG: OmpH family outer membrane protein [Gemmatimonadota bacterium]|nr:OmpH family outer membrane protein [Gemmatimonadota bacterium]